MRTDSLDLMMVYLAGMTCVPIHYKDQVFEPLPLHVSPSLFYPHQCVASCGACCMRFSLDWIGTECVPVGEWVEQTLVKVNGRQFRLFKYKQSMTERKHFCDHLQGDGSCGIYQSRPLSCELAPLRVRLHKASTQGPARGWLGQTEFGRMERYIRRDGGVGALCKFPKEPMEGARREAVRKLNKLQTWADYFHIPTRIPAIVEWAQAFPLEFVERWKVTVFSTRSSHLPAFDYGPEGPDIPA